MDYSTRRLRRLFEAIATTGLALGASACDHETKAHDAGVDDAGDGLPRIVSEGFPASDFETDGCAESGFHLLDGLSPAETVDGLLGRRVSAMQLPDAGTGGEFSDVRGTPCLTATDQDACAASIAALPSDTYVYEYPNVYDPSFPAMQRYQIAFTRGDTVAALQSSSDFVAFLGTIDSAREAFAAALAKTGLSTTCGRANVRTTSTGFQVVLQSGFACGTGTHRDEILVDVGSDGTVAVKETLVVELGGSNCVIGRLTDGVSVRCEGPTSLGEQLARMAALEAAAVHAFERLADEMVALGAPDDLVARARRSARDEARHVGIVAAQAARFGAAPATLEVAGIRDRSRFEIALENAREGMVRETYGALAAYHHANHARDPELARMFRALALDETRHAALAIDFGAWIEATLTEDERRVVDDARRAELEGLAEAVSTGVDDHSAAMLGWPTLDEARALVARAFPAAWDVHA